MNTFEIGDLVVLTSGSMRMAVERTEGDAVACVWCHEGIIGRDSFDARLLKRWEHREEGEGKGGAARSPSRSFRGENEGGGRPYRGERSERGSSRPYGEGAGGTRSTRRKSSEEEGEERPRARTGWDGKPREKKYFRKGE